jgi:hypothetical protein
VRKSLAVSGVAGAVAAGILAAFFWLNSGSGADRIGPLGGGPVNGTVCTPARPAVTIALDDFRNTTTAPIQVETFALVGARGLRSLGVSLAPVVSTVGGDLLGVGGAYPPSSEDLARAADVQWSDRRALPMTMPPDPPGHSWNLVIGLERTAAVGTAGFYQIQYEWNGQQYTWSGLTAIRLITGTRCP